MHTLKVKLANFISPKILSALHRLTSHAAPTCNQTLTVSSPQMFPSVVQLHISTTLGILNDCGGSRSWAAPFLGLAILLPKLCRQTAEDREDGEKAELEVKADM